MGDEHLSQLRRANLSHVLGRFLSFLKVLLRDKRGLVGISIIVFFALAAIAAPLLTPYDPLLVRRRIAAELTSPYWFKYLPGNERSSENLHPINDPEFTSNEALKEWAFTTDPSVRNLSVKYTTEEGGPRSGSGCIAILFNRYASDTLGEVKAVLIKEFYYPYGGPPKRFLGHISVKATGIMNVSQWGVEIKVFTEEMGGEKNVLWSARQGGIYRSESWIEPSIESVTGGVKYPPLIDSYILDTESEMFSKPGNNLYGVEVSFAQDVQEATIYIDDFDLDFYGSLFGLLGTDRLGRDIASQLLYGTRISLIIGLLAAFLSVTIGLGFGLFSGYSGGFVDEVMMRFTDMLLVLPELPLLIVLIAVLGSTVWNQILLIGFLGWMGFARTVRSQVLSLKERSFVEAAKAVGAGRLHVITQHMLPNVMNLVYVTLAMSVPYAIMSEAYISFLGLFDPTIVTWGRMLHEVLGVVDGVQRWWWIVPPGLCIAAISTAFIFIGYALDEILNPKLRERR